MYLKRLNNLFLAIQNQLTRPHAFRNIFITHNAWGIFSKNSHISSQGAKPKIAYPNKATALKAAETMSRKYGVHFSVYKCLWCDGWHIGKNRENKIKVSPLEQQLSDRLLDLPNPLYERLKKYPIVDLAPVLNTGVRGRTLSSTSHNWLLPKIKEAGIERIIDFRTTDISEKYEDKVKAAGMEYLHIAIDSRTTDARTIIADLPLLFEWLDKGHFYIACAMGLHRTDIALALYYVFHPSNALNLVPELRGHRVDGHLRIEDIATRLNSVMRALTPEDCERLQILENYEVEFNKRKKRLFAVNSNFSVPTSP